MPKLIFKGVPTQAVVAVSTRLLDELQELLDCPRESLSLEVVGSTFVRDGAVDPSPLPVVTVQWLDRPQNLQEAAVAIIARHLDSQGHSEADIIFSTLEQLKFYRLRA